jgi:hypothetical protein
MFTFDRVWPHRALEHGGAGFEEGAGVEARGGVARIVRRVGPNAGSLVTSTPHPGVLVAT